MVVSSDHLCTVSSCCAFFLFVRVDAGNEMSCLFQFSDRISDELCHNNGFL